MVNDDRVWMLYERCGPEMLIKDIFRTRSAAARRKCELIDEYPGSRKDANVFAQSLKIVPFVLCD